MNYSKSIFFLALAVVVCLAVPDTASAQRGGGGRAAGGGGHASGGGGHPSGGAVVGRAVPRSYGGGPAHYPGGGGYYGSGRYYGHNGYYRPYYPSHVVGYAPYYPYYYPYRPGFTVGFYLGFGYPYGYPAYPYYGSPYPYPYPYPYGAYGYPAPVPPAGAPPAGTAPPAGYVSMQPGYAYGGVRIQGAPLNAQVFADGYYIGVVDDFDGPTQHMNLQSGSHSIEIRPANQEPQILKVNVMAGQTVTYHAGIQQ
jgi:hypothetical protein